MAKRSAGISGVALLLTAAGAWLVFVGIRDVPPVGGLRDILRGNVPAGRASRQSFTSTAATSGIAEAAAAAGKLVTVYGIRVDESISPAVSQLVRGALPNLLTGGGYRTSTQQAEARRKNGCTCSDSSSCCRVPTAPVGSSMHEQGLAVDFSWNGALISSRNSAGFRYLQAHAPALGLKNLPSEPWHWSTNGK